MSVCQTPVALIFGHPQGTNEALPVIKAIIYPTPRDLQTPEQILKEIAVEFVQDEVGRSHYVDTLAITDMYPEQYPPGTVVLSYTDASETLIRCHRVIGKESRGWFSTHVEKSLEYLGYFAIVQVGLPIVLAAPAVVAAIPTAPKQLTRVIQKSKAQDEITAQIQNFDMKSLRHYTASSPVAVEVEEDGYVPSAYGTHEEEITQ